MKRVLTLVMSIVLVGACGGSGPSKAATAGFTIDFPAQGAVVTTSPVEVRGKASPGARIVRDVSFAPDDDVIAGSDGTWVMQVELKAGANELVFRVGDDSSTEQKLGLTYKPAGSTPAQPAATQMAAASTEPTSGPAITQAPTPVVPTPKPTPPPPTPTPAPTFRTILDGIWEVGVDIKPGTYRLREPGYFCYWARLKGFDGTLNDIIANGNENDAYGVVTIKASDAGFESNGCDEWSSDLSRVTDDKSHIDYDGTYIVGTDIAAGKWKSTGGDGLCYCARLSAFTGTLNAVIANALPSGPTIVTIRSTDKGFTTTGCGSWVRQ